MHAAVPYLCPSNYPTLAMPLVMARWGKPEVSMIIQLLEHDLKKECIRHAQPKLA